MKVTMAVTTHSYVQITINESTLIRICLDNIVYLIQRVYYTSATMLFVMVNEVVSLHLNDIHQLLRRKNFSASQFDTLKESYYLCIEAVNEVNDTFGWLLLAATLHDFVMIVTEGMHSAANSNNFSEWYIYFLNMVSILYCLANFASINFSGHRLTNQVIIKHSVSSYAMKSI